MKLCEWVLGFFVNGGIQMGLCGYHLIHKCDEWLQSKPWQVFKYKL